MGTLLHACRSSKLCGCRHLRLLVHLRTSGVHQTRARPDAAQGDSRHRPLLDACVADRSTKLPLSKVAVCDGSNACLDAAVAKHRTAACRGRTPRARQPNLPAQQIAVTNARSSSVATAQRTALPVRNVARTSRARSVQPSAPTRESCATQRTTVQIGHPPASARAAKRPRKRPHRLIHG